MNSYDSNFYSLGYWENLYLELLQEYLDKHSSANKSIQDIGIVILERADLALNPNNLIDLDSEEERQQLISKIINVLLLAIEEYPEFIFNHLYLTIGSFSYAGILNLFEPKIEDMWHRVFKKYQASSKETERALSDLAALFLIDRNLAGKLEIYINGMANDYFINMTNEELIYTLEKKFTLNGFDDISIINFYRLGIFDEEKITYQPANLEDNIVEAGILIRKIHRLAVEMDSSKKLKKIYKRFQYQQSMRALNKRMKTIDFS